MKKRTYAILLGAQCLAGVTIAGISYWLGKETENYKWNETLDYMAKTGTTMSNIVNGKEYVCSVTEVIK